MIIRQAIDYLKGLMREENPAALAVTEIARCQEIISSLEPHPNYLLEYRNWEFCYWSHIPAWIIADHRKLRFKKSLDIGCAYGTLSLFCKKVCRSEIFCTDFIDVFISKALIKEHGFNFRVNNIELDPFPWDTSFDLILLTEVMEHFNFNPVPTLEKIHGLLSKKGRLYLSTPDAASWGKVTKYHPSLEAMPQPQRGLPVFDDHIYVYDRDELIKVVTAAGFTVERLEYSKINEASNFNLTLSRAK